MDGRAGVTLKLLCALVLLGSLTGCGCALDRGDSTKVGEYWDGCWAVAKDRKNKDDRIFPRA